MLNREIQTVDKKANIIIWHGFPSLLVANYFPVSFVEQNELSEIYDNGYCNYWNQSMPDLAML